MDADKAGVEVFGLGALNKNEALNGGGALFVKKHPNLRMRVVHGNTLIAACGHITPATHLGDLVQHLSMAAVLGQVAAAEPVM